jgi:hypothetical protein
VRKLLADLDRSEDVAMDVSKAIIGSSGPLSSIRAPSVCSRTGRNRLQVCAAAKRASEWTVNGQ